MNKLTKREKILIYLLVIVVIAVFGVRFGIVSLAEKYSDLKEVQSEAELQKQEYEYMISGIPGYESSVTDLDNEISAIRDNLLPFMASDDIDDLLTGMLLECSLHPVSLAINESYEAIVPYGDNSVTDTTGTAGKDAGNGRIAVSTAYINSTAENTSSVLKFIDRIEGTYGLRITSLTISEAAGEVLFGAEITIYMNPLGE